MTHTSQNCPMYLAENGKWASTLSPICNCYDQSKIVTHHDCASVIRCIAPSHTWDALMTAETARWICRNCGLKSF